MLKGSILNIKFAPHREGLRGLNEQYSKLALISKHYKGEATPQCDEFWWCKVGYDSVPENVRSGFLFLMPIRKVVDPNEAPPSSGETANRNKATLSLPGASPALKPAITTPLRTTEWQVNAVKETSHTAVYAVKRIIRRNEEEKRTTFKSVLLVDVSIHWPEHVIQQVCALLAGDRLPAGSTSELRWEVREDKQDERDSVVVSGILYAGGKEILRQERVLKTTMSVDFASWPAEIWKRAEALVKDQTRRRIQAEAAAQKSHTEMLAEARRKRDAERAEQQKEVARVLGEKKEALQKRAAEKQQLVGKLTSSFNVAVVDLQEAQYTLTILGAMFDRRVLQEGVEIGVFGGRVFSLIGEEEFPITVRRRTITLSSGVTVAVDSHNVNVGKREQGGGVLQMVKAFVSTCQIAVVGRQELKWDDAEHLKVGDVVGQEYRFQRIGDYVTEGTVWFPLVRPTGGAAWKELPVKAIPAPWDTYLDGLVGKRLADLAAYHKHAGSKVKSEAKPRLTDEQKRRYARMTGKMWKGENADDITLVDNGNVVYHLLGRKGRNDLHIVENAGIGAMYFHYDKSQALDVAEGRIPRKDAMKMFPRIVHVEGWEDELQTVLEDPAAEATLFASIKDL